MRLFDPAKYEQKALTFRTYGPLTRFDHQPRISDKPAKSTNRGILYTANTLSSCIVEVFGDYRIIDVGSYMVARIYVKENLFLLDLRGKAAMKAGTVAAIAMNADHDIGQQWSKYFYEQAFLYEEIDGLIYNNAHNGETAYALYERSAAKLDLLNDCPLADDALRGTVLKIALAHNLLITPYTATAR